MSTYYVSEDLQACHCCGLVDTTVHVRDKPRCSLCREFCLFNQPCAVKSWLESGPAGRDEMKGALRDALHERKPHR